MSAAGGAPELRPGSVWITRARPGAETTADRVRALGFEPLVAPLLEARPVGQGPLDLTGVAALAFSSRNGVEAFAARSAERGLPVFTVGAATAAAARAAGFARVISADGDVRGLGKAIADRAGDLTGAVLHASAAETAGDLSADLTGRGIPVRREIVYETAPTPLDEEVRLAIPGLSAALVHSPKAARQLARILRDIPAPAMRLLCLSPAVAAPLSGEISTAALPNEEALLNLLTRRECP